MKGWLLVAGTSIVIVLGIWIVNWKRRAPAQSVSAKWLNDNTYVQGQDGDDRQAK